MKLTMVVLILLALVGITGTAMAAPVTVDFSVLGINTVDITTAINPGGYTLNGITFRYDDLGSGIDSAQVDANGIFGSRFGSLVFDFSVPVTALTFDFSLLGISQPVTDAVNAVFNSAGSGVGTAAVNSVANDINGDAAGTLAYTGVEFDNASIFFWLDDTVVDTQFFSVQNISYEPVPEPSTFVILACGLVGLGGLGRFTRKR